MSSTYINHYFHIVFATKGREPSIQAEWRSRLHDYLGGLVNRLAGQILVVGGVADHVHLLVKLDAMHLHADFMRELKKASSSWVRKEMKQPRFTWQEGYASLTVSASNVPAVQTYIRKQEHHHRKINSRDELLKLLRRAGVKVDLRFFD